MDANNIPAVFCFVLAVMCSAGIIGEIVRGKRK